MLRTLLVVVHAGAGLGGLLLGLPPLVAGKERSAMRSHINLPPRP